MDTKFEVQEQTAIRRKLLLNGYSPLANKAKMCVLKGWPRIDADDDMIDEWNGMLAYRSTGVRIDDDLCVIDVDVQDSALVAQLWARMSKIFGQAWQQSVLIRVRANSAKEAWVFRVATDDAVPFIPPGPKYDDGEGVEHAVEIFTSGSPRQIGAYGWHTEPKGGAPGVKYEWVDDLGPAEVAMEHLPVVPLTDVEHVYEVWKEIAEDAGLEQVTRFQPGEWKPDVYDIPKIDAKKLPEPGTRLAARDLPWLDDPSPTPERLVVTERHDGVMGVHDFKYAQTHWPVGEEPEDPGEKTFEAFERLGDMVRDAGVEMPPPGAVGLAPPEVATWREMNDLLERLVNEYVLFPNGASDERWIRVRGGLSYSDEGLRKLFEKHALRLDTYTPSGKPTTKVFNPIELLPKREDLIAVSGYRFTPGVDAQLIEDNGDFYVNVWHPPMWEGVDPEPDARWFDTFMEYLIPNEREREWFMNWLRCKVQDPMFRGVGVVLVTSEGGTGRNVLMKLVKNVLGTKWCSDVSAPQLLGVGSQSSFDDLFINRVLVTCDEIVRSSGATRKENLAAYERLKMIVDTFPQMRSFNRKGLSVVEDMAYYSVLMASNHEASALPLDEKDRRIAVLTCTDTPFREVSTGRIVRPDIAEIVNRVLPYKQMPHAPAIAALAEHLKSVPGDVERALTPPSTSAREAMIDNSKGEVVEALDRWLRDIPEAQMAFRFDEMLGEVERRLKDRGSVWLAAKQELRDKLGSRYRDDTGRYWVLKKDIRVSRAPGTPAEVMHRIVVRADVDTTPEERAQWL